MKTNQNDYELYSFLKAVRGNWHNALFLSCGYCTCTQNPGCKGFLLAVDADGCPILMPVEKISILTGEDIEPEGCLAIVEKQLFETVYSLYLEWHTSSMTGCPLYQLCQMPRKAQT